MELQAMNDFLDFNENSFTKRIIFKKGGTVVFSLHFMPGQALPAHTHPGSDVFLLVLDGEGTFVIDDKNVTVKCNDALHCNGEEKLSFINSSEKPVSLYVMLNKLPEERYAQNV